MNATDLMLGDWVYNSSKEKCKVYAISNIFDSNIHLDNYDKPNDGCFELAFEVEPILLTTEILEKNGFVLKEEDVGAFGVNIVPYYTRDDVPFEVFCDGEPFAIWFKDPVNIAFVHQLQHALRLCGIYKEIVL